MNSCILMAEIVEEPQLRYTADNKEITEMLVRFPNSQRPEDPPATLKVVGWGTLAAYIQQNYHQGDRVIIEGRLGMITIERREGFKEKRAELTAQRIYPMGSSSSDSFPKMELNSDLREQTAASSNRNSPEIESPVAKQEKSISSSNDSPRQITTPAKNHQDEPTPQNTNYNRGTYQPTKQEEIDPDDIPF